MTWPCMTSAERWSSRDGTTVQGQFGVTEVLLQSGVLQSGVTHEVTLGNEIRRNAMKSAPNKIKKNPYNFTSCQDQFPIHDFYLSLNEADCRYYTNSKKNAPRDLRTPTYVDRRPRHEGTTYSTPCCPVRWPTSCDRAKGQKLRVRSIRSFTFFLKSNNIKINCS